MYLPESWTQDPARRAAAGIPHDQGLVTKPHLGISMLRRAIADPAMVFGWVGDCTNNAPTQPLPRTPTGQVNASVSP